MQTKIIGEWELEYDKNKTEKANNKCMPAIENCDCQGCKNYYCAFPQFLNEIKIFFDNFSIDMGKPIEIYKNRKILYAGFYYIVGKINKGKNIWEEKFSSKDSNDKMYSQNNVYKINNDFEIGFTYKISISDNNFPESIFQMEISFWVPYVIDDKNYLKHFSIEKGHK